ncbi:hypothetical protein [Streptomyces inhibens]|uniref:hypothetical protein n=1 Tax=Streptomyces inhibens TaxID=2293571 RepID=UPI0015F28BF2|nr:hypothetical protein [Streptomyces inhibens]
MHAQETTFSKLVQGEKQFQVPLYRRTYSRQREELQARDGRDTAYEKEIREDRARS